MKKESTIKLTTAALLLAIIIVMQLVKNTSAYISGPIINTVLAIAMLKLGTLWGLGFSIIVPFMSIVFAPASAMTAITYATSFCTLPIIIIGNIIFIVCAKLGSKKTQLIFTVSLIIGAVLKWLFMWGCGDLILLSVFADSLGKLTAVVTKVFSTLQLYSGLLSIILIVPINIALEKATKKL